MIEVLKLLVETYIQIGKRGQRWYIVDFIQFIDRLEVRLSSLVDEWIKHW